MRAAERGFLLLSSSLGNPERKPLTTAQMRTLADRSWQLEVSKQEDRELSVSDLTALGYGRQMAQRILSLLSQEDLLEHYLRRAQRSGCLPLTRISQNYPLILRKRLGLDSPGVLWTKGELSLLQTPMIALAGSRELAARNGRFAAEVGRQAARQGYTLVSGNARGADRTAQEACLQAGGSVIVVVADALEKHTPGPNVLYISEEDFEQPFSAQRAISRNRVIHCLAERTFVAQSGCRTGGTWDGTVKNLRFGWSPVYCFRDNSPAVELLCRMGAVPVDMEDLQDLNILPCDTGRLF